MCSILLDLLPFSETVFQAYNSYFSYDWSYPATTRRKMSFSPALQFPQPIWTFWGPYQSPTAIYNARWYTLIHFPEVSPCAQLLNSSAPPWKRGGRRLHCVHPIPTAFLQHLDHEELQYLEVILAENLAAFTGDMASVQMRRRVEETLNRVLSVLRDREIDSYLVWKMRTGGAKYAHLLTGHSGRDQDRTIPTGDRWWHNGLKIALHPVHAFGATSPVASDFVRIVDADRENVDWIG